MTDPTLHDDSPDLADLPPPRPEAQPAPGPRPTPLRERLPEVAATIGAILVSLAAFGFLASYWGEAGQYQKAMILGAGAAGLSAMAAWFDQLSRRLSPVVAIAWSTGTVLVVAAVALVVSTAWPGYGRVSLMVAGLAGAAHAAYRWIRRPESILGQVMTLAAVVFASGPFGRGLSDTFGLDDLELLAVPLEGFVDPTVTSAAFVLTGLLHALVGALWVALAFRLSGMSRAVAHGSAVILLGFAALELNVASEPLGAVGALAIVIGYLLAGVVRDDAVLIGVGAVGSLVAGVRVVAALFSGETAATVAVFAGGLALLGWAIQQVRRRELDNGST